MSKFIFLGFLNFLLFINATETFAQSQEYTDHKPVYRKWKDNYILDKIEYTKTSTIFYFRFVCESDHRAIFYEPGHESAWYLKGKNGKDYKLKAVKNIRRNGATLVSNLTTEKEFLAIEGFDYTTFSCEVHFERLPNSDKVVDLIEGEGFENDESHFNCFDVVLKTWDNKELGKVEDSKKQIQKFENKFGITNTDVEVQPKVEPKVEPKKNPVIIELDPPKVEVKQVPDPDNPYPIRRLRYKSDIVCNEKMVLDKFKFQDNSSEFIGMVQCQYTMRIIYEYMMLFPNTTATIIGHTDVFGSGERNLELSKERAIKIQSYLYSMGISPERVNIEFYGAQQPIKAEGSPLNRRAEIIIKCN